MKFNRLLVAALLMCASADKVSAQVSSENLVSIHNLNTTEISGLASPIKGSLVYNTDSNRLYVFDGASWIATASVDTSSLSNRINQRVKYADTAALLIGYLRKGDTASMLSSYINQASNGLTKSGQTVTLGGSLTTATTISNNGNALTIATGGGALNISGLGSGASTDSLLTINTVSGRVNRVAPAVLNKVDSTTASNGLTLSGKDVRLGGTLTAATTITNSGSNTLRIASLASGTASDSLVVADATSGELKRISGSRLNVADSTTASNGLTLNGKDVRLGGTLTAATTITNSGANTLRIASLATGTTNDSLVVADATSGELKRISGARLSKADSTTASNGLTLNGKDVQLGGNLSAATTVSNNGNILTFATGGSNLNITGLGSGASTDSILTISGMGKLSRINAANFATTASNGLAMTGADVRLGGNLTQATTITNNSNTLTFATGGADFSITGLTSGAATDSIMTITAAGKVNRLNAANFVNTASNGLTMTGKDIKLGGSLTAATTITTSAANTLSIAGLQTSSLSDSVLMVSAGGVVRRMNSALVALEPFNVVGGTTKASSNTQDIYTQGSVSIGKTTNSATLEVGGKVKADSSVTAPNFVSTYQDFGSRSGSLSWNMQLGATAAVTLSGNVTLSISNAAAGMYGLIRVTQGTTPRTITLPASSKVINGGSGNVSLTQSSGAVDILTFFYDGTTYWWTIGNNYN